MFGYIYLTTNLVNKKVYIGQHRADKFEPESYIGSGTLLWRAIKKYGRENFSCDMLCECLDQDDMDEKERYFIALYNSTDKQVGYNMTDGGFGGASPRTPETKLKIGAYTASTYLVNDGNICFRIPRDELDEYISLGYVRGCLPYTRSEEFKKKVKETTSGRIGIHKDGVRTRIDIEDLDKYLTDGWEKGWVDSSQKKTYVKYLGEGKKLAIHKGDKLLVVPESLIPSYQDDGWEIGGLPRSQEWKEKIVTSNKATYFKKAVQKEFKKMLEEDKMSDLDAFEKLCEIRTESTRDQLYEIVHEYMHNIPENVTLSKS